MSRSTNPNVDPSKTVGHRYPPQRCTYNRRDAMLYALGIGCTEPRFIYEGDSDFGVFPTYPVCWSFKGASSDVVQFGSNAGGFPGLNFNPMNILHGEEELELLAPLPDEASLTAHGVITQLWDKGSGATVVTETRYVDDASGADVALKRTTVFIRGLGGFGGERGPAARAASVPAGRAPDRVARETVPALAAALYRLSGDYNPLHIDADMAEAVGFRKPILHGLATLGYSARAVLREFAANEQARFRSIAVRFSKPVLPGDTLAVEMWALSPTEIAFQTKVGDAVVISNGLVRLHAAKAKL